MFDTPDSQRDPDDSVECKRDYSHCRAFVLRTCDVTVVGAAADDADDSIAIVADVAAAIAAVAVVAAVHTIAAPVAAVDCR